MNRQRLLAGVNGAALVLALGTAAAIVAGGIQFGPGAAAGQIAEAADESHEGHAHAAPEAAEDSAAAAKTDACCPVAGAPVAPAHDHETGGAHPHEEAEHGHAASESHEVDWCAEHDLAEQECGICQPARTALLQPGEGLKLRFAADDAAERAGVETGMPAPGASAEDAVHLARVTYNQSSLAHVTPRVQGVIEEVLVDLGDEVKAGAPLARLAAPGVAQAWSDLKSAQAEEVLSQELFEREKMLWEKEVSSTQEYRTAEAALKQARIRTQLAREQLANTGVRADEPGANASNSLVPVRAPLSGTIVEWHAIVGENADPAENLFTIADLSSMWLELSVPATAADSVQKGDHVEARLEGLEGIVLEGEIDWIASKVDPQARTVAARAVVPNPGQVLRDGMVAQVQLRREGIAGALHVPVDAIQEYDGKPYVFVQLADDLYEVRQVLLGGRQAGRVAVTAGLASGEKIVLARSFTVKSEFLKSRLGAGCADH